MHPEAIRFMKFVQQSFPEYFTGKVVLDVGAGDVNGNNRSLFNGCEYHGNDVIPARNITIISKTKDLPFEDEMFDTIISTECFEHDPEYTESFLKIYQMLKPDGLFAFTCATTGRGEHGTRRTDVRDSYGSVGNLPDMIDYYKNVTEEDLNDVLNLKLLFTSWDTYTNSVTNDLYFVGIKKGAQRVQQLPQYTDVGVEHTSYKLL